jgi:hypothetical protein
LLCLTDAASQVLLATCFDDAQLQQLESLKGQYVRLEMDPLGNVSATVMDAPQGDYTCMPAACPTFKTRAQYLKCLTSCLYSSDALKDVAGFPRLSSCACYRAEYSPTGLSVLQWYDSVWGVAASGNGASSNGAGKLPPINIPKPEVTQRWALQEADFGQGLVGGKSSNLALLRAKVGSPSP